MLTIFAGTTGVEKYLALGVAIFYPLSIVISFLFTKRDKA